MPVLSQQAARQIYGSLTSDQLSAGAGGRDSCQGDSGGPLTAPSARGRVQIGVVSWGYGCGDADHPGLYARVSFFSAWIAQTTGAPVGAGAPSASPTPPPTAAPTTLLDRDVSGAAGSFQHFAITVPAGARSLEVVLSGPRADADLYVREGRRPTATLWNCRPYTAGSNELCKLARPAAGTWYVSVAGYSDYGTVHVTAPTR